MAMAKVKRLQERMVAEGFSPSTIAAAIMSSFDYRRRAAWRLALGLSQTALADRYNARFTKVARAPMSASRVSAFERWPEAGERPGPESAGRRLANSH